MTDNNSSSGLTTCSIVCWLLAFAFGVFVAAALIGWTGMHGLVAAVLGLIAMLLAGWILKGMFCVDDTSSSVSSTPSAAAVSASAVGTAAAAPTTEAPAAAKSTATAKTKIAAPKAKVAAKPATKKAAPAKKTAAKSTTTAKTKTAAPEAKAATKPAAKKAVPATKIAAKSTTAAKAKTAAAKKPAAAKPATAKKPAAKKATAAKFYTKAPAKVDDLKLISGVGPKLEETLNKIGVYKYEQVAVWKKADIKKVDDQLRFKGRIERDDWMKQAKVLAKGGDTEFSKKKRK